MSESQKSAPRTRSGRLSGRDPVGRLSPPPPGRRIRVFTSDHAAFEGDAEWALPSDPLLPEEPLRQIHSARTTALPLAEAAPAACASCRDDVAEELNYRLVLRCSSPSTEA